MAQLNEIVGYCDVLMQVDKFRDYCPNGLQVEGRSEVRKIVSAVTASQDAIDAAVAAGADLLLVHHGFFWKNENPVLTGPKKRRIKTLLENDLSLLAYHLPLDAHPEIGNNAQLGRLLNIEFVEHFDTGSPLPWGFVGKLHRKLSGNELSDLINEKLGRFPLHIPGHSREIEKIAWCTGGAQGYFEVAAMHNIDAYISGEVSEQTYHQAKELGIDYFSAGHYATERYGVQALAEKLVGRFNLTHDFVEINNPV
ncbi:MAG: Nif3-like dinuclear metal center hexameric protein [Gammaproteobacteria bacterium]|nr:Nif3-like dinuclear metal center hexameric protein [Gammaproteobacteria bacterium]